MQTTDQRIFRLQSKIKKLFDELEVIKTTDDDTSYLSLEQGETVECANDIDGQDGLMLFYNRGKTAYDCPLEPIEENKHTEWKYIYPRRGLPQYPCWKPNIGGRCPLDAAKVGVFIIKINGSLEAHNEGNKVESWDDVRWYCIPFNHMRDNHRL